MSDQHAAHALGCYGNPDVRTPVLDQLAREGVRFANAFSNSPICGPSRCSFLSGQYVPSHGVTANTIRDAHLESRSNVAAHFRRHGYQTAIIGKAHLPRLWVDEGFEYQRLSDPADTDNGDPLTSCYYRHLVEQGLGDEWDLGKLHPPHPGADMSAFTSRLPYEHSIEHWTGDEALAFLRQRNKQRPFFCKVSFQRPHDPIAPSFDSPHTYTVNDLTLPASATDYFERAFEGKPAFQQAYARDGHGGYPYRSRSREELREQMAAYYSLITSIDAEIGRVIEELRTSGELANTLIVYHSDHGDFSGQHGLMLKNFGIYESIHCFPLILRFPEQVNAGCFEGIVESVDLAPTFCDLAGIQPEAAYDGRSLAQMASGNEPSKSEACCVWDFPLLNQKHVVAVRSKNYRLVYYLNNPDDGELYDRNRDPDELENRFHDPALRNVRLDMTERLLRHCGNFRRRLSFDQIPNARTLDFLVARRGVKWSDIERFYA